MKMKHKQNVIAVMLSIIILIFMGGCSGVASNVEKVDSTVKKIDSTVKNVENTAKSTDKNIQEDVINYVNVELPKIVDIENKVITGYSSVTGDKYKDDKTTYTKLKNQVIPDSLKLVADSEKITPKTEELRVVHELYLSSINEQNSAFTLILSALETGDTSTVAQANDKLTKARKAERDFLAKLKELEVKYNVTVTDK